MTMNDSGFYATPERLSTLSFASSEVTFKLDLNEPGGDYRKQREDVIERYVSLSLSL